MMKQRLFSTLTCVAVLSACAVQSPAPPVVAIAPVTMASAMADAAAAVKAGHDDQAYVLLKIAAGASPRDKAPWLRMAQMRFDEKNYGEAIVSGLEAIERDPNDMLAYSLVAVSGLRVSSKALGDLTQKNGFNGSVRSEAQDLANLLHTTLKVEKIVPVKAGAPIRNNASKAILSAPAGPAVKAAPAAKACSGPFCALN